LSARVEESSIGSRSPAVVGSSCLSRCIRCDAPGLVFLLHKDQSAHLGILSLGHSEPNCFTPEHLRLTKSLAVPAAAILNGRLYECSKIYGAELEKRTSDLQEAHSNGSRVIVVDFCSRKR